MRVLFWAICLSTIATYTSEAMCTSVDQGTSTAQVKERPITRHLLTVYQTRSSLNICRQMAFFEIVQTLILRFANMEKKDQFAKFKHANISNFTVYLLPGKLFSSALKW